MEVAIGPDILIYFIITFDIDIIIFKLIFLFSFQNGRLVGAAHDITVDRSSSQGDPPPLPVRGAKLPAPPRPDPLNLHNLSCALSQDEIYEPEPS